MVVYRSVFDNPQVRECSEHIGQKIYADVGRHPITLIPIGSGGVPYAMGISDYLQFNGADVKYVQIRNATDPIDTSHVKDRIIIFVDDGIVNMYTHRTVKEREQEFRNAGAIDFKFATFNDLRGVADYSYYNSTDTSLRGTHFGRPENILPTAYQQYVSGSGWHLHRLDAIVEYISRGWRYFRGNESSKLREAPAALHAGNSVKRPIVMPSRRDFIFGGLLLAMRKKVDNNETLRYVEGLLDDNSD